MTAFLMEQDTESDLGGIFLGLFRGRDFGRDFGPPRLGKTYT